MTTIIIDEAGLMPVAELLRQATDDVVELRQASGTLVGTLMLHRPPSRQEYAKFLAAAEAEIDELRRRAYRPEPGITTAELLSKLLQLTLNERS
jgi:hypothetical protein